MRIFDLESEPLDEDRVRHFAPPFVKPAHPGSFDPLSVAYGNTKDETKRSAKLEECRAKHAAAVNSYEQDCVEAETKHWQEAMQKAALNPVTGRVVVVGIKSLSGKETFLSGDEPDILGSFWRQYEETRLTGLLIGANIFSFDLPFLIRRSWLNHVEVPDTVRDGRWWNRCFVDVRDAWLLGQRYSDCESSLSLMARALGVGDKLPGDIGANFGKLWRGTPADRELALKYLKRDLELTLAIARRLQIVY